MKISNSVIDLFHIRFEAFGSRVLLCNTWKKLSFFSYFTSASIDLAFLQIEFVFLLSFVESLFFVQFYTNFVHFIQFSILYNLGRFVPFSYLSDLFFLSVLSILTHLFILYHYLILSIFSICHFPIMSRAIDWKFQSCFSNKVDIR